MQYLPDRYPDHDPDYFHVPQDSAPSFPGLSMRDFMQQTSVYEHQPAPFSPLLRRATWTGLLLTLLVSLLIWLLPGVGQSVQALFFPLLPADFNHFLVGYLAWLAHSPLIGYVNGALLIAGGVLLIATRNLRQGNLAQQWIAFVETLGGVGNLLLVLAPLALVLANVLGWVLAFLVLFILLALVVRALATML